MNKILENARRKLNLVLDDLVETNLLKEMFENRYNLIYCNGDFNSHTELLIDILENEVIKILDEKKEKRTKQQTLILEQVKLLYIEKLVQHREMMIDSKLFKNPYYEMLFNDIQLQRKINDCFQNIRKDAGFYYQKFMKNEALDDYEQVTLFKFLIANLNTDNKILINIMNNVVKKILELNGNVHIIGKEFLIKFIVHEKCQQLGLNDIQVYIGNRDLINDEVFSFAGITYYSSFIMINDSLLRKPGDERDNKSNISQLTRWIHTIYHELRHYKQNIELKSGKLTLSAWNSVKNKVLRRFLSKDNFNEYITNYRFVENEREANLAGWLNTIEFLNKYSPHLKREIELVYSIQNKMVKLGKYAYKKKRDVDEKLVLYSMEKYNIENLSEIIKNNSYLLDKYKILRLLFNKNGLKDVNVLIQELTVFLMSDFKEKSEIIDIYFEGFSYYFNKIKLVQFEEYIDKFSDDEQYVIFCILLRIFIDDCTSLNDMMDVLEFDDDLELPFDRKAYYNLFMRISSLKAKRIKKCYVFLSRSQERIEKITKRNSKLLKSGRGLTLDFSLNLLDISRNLICFLNRVERLNEEFQNTEFAKFLRSLPNIINNEIFELVINKPKEEIHGNSRK